MLTLSLKQLNGLLHHRVVGRLTLELMSRNYRPRRTRMRLVVLQNQEIESKGATRRL